MRKTLPILLLIIFCALIAHPSHAAFSAVSIYPREGPAGTTVTVFFNQTDFNPQPQVDIWYDDLFIESGTLAIDHASIVTPTIAPYSNPGVHNVTARYSVYNGAGYSPVSTAQFTFNVTVPPLQALLFWQGSATIVNQSVTFYASIVGGTPPVIYTWSFGDGMTAGGNPITHTFQNQGVYTVTVTGTDSKAQSITASQMISVISLPKPVAGPQGPTGPQGSPGPAGPPGPQGPSGTQGAAELPSNNSTIVYAAFGVSTLAIIISALAIISSRRRIG